MASEHLFKFGKSTPTDQTKGGIRLQANVHNFPILKGMSLYKLILHPNGVREPHWHANADELGYCLKGEVLVSIYNTGDVKATFIVREGEVFFIPSGALHHIEALNGNGAELVLHFSHEDPEDFGISGVFGAFSNAVLGNTWGVKQEIFQSMKRSLKSTFANLRKKPAIVDEENYGSQFRFNLMGSKPLIQNAGGAARMARQNVWPIVHRQALYALTLTGKGMREPHWHPETAELGYIEKGKGRMTIISPSEKIDTYIIEEGDVYFIPKAYPHHIENLNADQELKILIFFDQPMPRDIGFTGSIRSYSDDVLGASTNMDPRFFESLPKYYVDAFIVEKTNPVDPV